jgi:hypothetical protein
MSDYTYTRKTNDDDDAKNDAKNDAGNASSSVCYSSVPRGVATPPGYYRAIHRFRTEFLPIGVQAAMTPRYDAEFEERAKRDGFPAPKL